MKWSGTIALIGFLLFLASGSAEETEVSWDVVGCSIQLEAPGAVDLGEGVPGDTLESNPNQGEVEIDTNCSYTVSARLASLNVPTGHPDPDGVRERFEWRTAQVSPDPEIENLQETYTSFPDFTTEMGVCRSAAAASPPFTHHKCRLQYRYTISFEDVVGTYTALIEITASTP